MTTKLPNTKCMWLFGESKEEKLDTHRNLRAGSELIRKRANQKWQFVFKNKGIACGEKALELDFNGDNFEDNSEMDGITEYYSL